MTMWTTLAIVSMGYWGEGRLEHESTSERILILSRTLDDDPHSPADTPRALVDNNFSTEVF